MRAIGLAGIFVLVACGPSGNKEGQCQDSLVAGDLVITEVFADFKAPVGGSGVDEGKEWFEIYNASDRPIELEGLRVDHSRPDGTKLESHTMDAVTIAPGQYFTLGNATSDLLPAYVDYGYSADLGDFFNSDGGKLALACGDAEIDSATYESVQEGRTRQLTGATFPDYTLNDDPNNWCEAVDAEFDVGNFGTPGGENDCQPVLMGACNDGGTSRPTVPPLPGELVITEVMPSPAGDDNLQEWFEAKALVDMDLNGLGLDRAGDTTVNPDLIESPDCIHVTAGSYVIFAKNVDMTMNGGLPAGAIKGTFDFSMVGGSVTSPGDVQIVSGATIIDAITWTSSTTGASLQIDPDLEDSSANDNESNFCDGTASYGAGGTGSPADVNVQCVLLPPAGMCSDGGTNRPIVKPTVGQLVITEFLANPAGTGTDAAQEWFEITNTSLTSFDLNDLGLKGNAATINLITSADCKPVGPAGFALFAHNIDPIVNGGLPAVDATFSFAIAASNGSLTVLDGVAVIDATTWTTPTIPETLTRQLNPLTPSSTDNDVQTNFCNSTTAQPYGTAGNFGTPKALNVCL